MAHVLLTNRSRGPIVVELNTGETIHLAPGEQTRPLEGFEVDDNRWLDGLTRSGSASVRLVEGAAAESPEPPAPGRPARRRARADAEAEPPRATPERGRPDHD